MGIMTNEDLALIKVLMSYDEAKTKEYVSRELDKYYRHAVIERDKYILAFGSIPVVLVAHLDTVEEKCKAQAVVVYDQEQELMTTLNTFGFDDKLGVFSILKLVKMGYRPNIIFCCGEERGGIGSGELVKEFTECPFGEVKYLMELDRMGYNNFVTYSNGDKEIVNYIEMVTSYHHEYGSYSDVETIGPVWGIGYFNASVGYYDEHTPNEHVNVAQWRDQFDQWRCLLELADDAPFFKYKEDFRSAWSWSPTLYPREEDYYDIYGKDDGMFCDECGAADHPEELIQVIDEDGKTVYLCPTCAAKLVDICEICDTPFIARDKDQALCPFCEKEIGENYKDLFKL